MQAGSGFFYSVLIFVLIGLFVLEFVVEVYVLMVASWFKFLFS